MTEEFLILLCLCTQLLLYLLNCIYLFIYELSHFYPSRSLLHPPRCVGLSCLMGLTHDTHGQRGFPLPYRELNSQLHHEKKQGHQPFQ